MPKRELTSNQRLILDLLPLGAFFIAYRTGGLMWATSILIGATLISLTIIYVLERRIAMAPLISGIVVAVFGGLTIALNDELFIKMKPTLINTLFALILLIGAYGFKRGLLKYILQVAFTLSEEGWRILSIRWGYFFLFLAVLNEIIWRNSTTDFWVSFKVFGMFTLTVMFAISQFRLVKQYETK